MLAPGFDWKWPELGLAAGLRGLGVVPGSALRFVSHEGRKLRPILFMDTFPLLLTHERIDE